MKPHVMVKRQRDAYSTPWSMRHLAAAWLWSMVWLFLFRPTPKFLSPWRVLLLRLFGARISGRPFVSESARIKYPWKLWLEDRACLGPHCDVYNLGPVILRARCTISRHVSLCAGSHDLATPNLPLITAPIVIGRDAFIGTHVIITLGVTIGEGAVAGAGSVVTKDLPAWKVCAGNPCKPLKNREFCRE